jgi:hypothetical protein
MRTPSKRRARNGLRTDAGCSDGVEHRRIGHRLLAAGVAGLLAAGFVLVLAASAPEARTRPPPPPLALPWTAGKAWTYLGGPHNTNGCPNGGFNCTNGHPWNSLDLTGPDGIVRAAASGTVEDTDRCPARGSSLVIINHGQGWHTTYYHVANVRVHPGDPVDLGQRIGSVSNLHGCGGHSDGAHVHFSVAYYTGDYSWTSGGVDLDHFQIGDWVFHDGRTQYSGCATNVVNGRRVCPGGSIRDDDAVVCQPISPVVWLTEKNVDCDTARQAVTLWNSFPDCRRDGTVCHVTTTDGDDPDSAIDWACKVPQGDGPDELRCSSGHRLVVGKLAPQ